VAAVWAAAFGLAACGGDDNSSDELVRLHMRDMLGFRGDVSPEPGQSQDRGFPIDLTIVVDRDGSGTETTADGATRDFEVTSSELETLEEALGRLDLNALEQRFGADKEGEGTIAVTYGGKTSVLDNRVVGLAGDGPAQALSRVVATLVGFADSHPSGGAARQPSQVGSEPSR